MGNYINRLPNGMALGALNKSDEIAIIADREYLSPPPFEDMQKDLILIAVVDNRIIGMPFEAAMVCDNEHDHGRIVHSYSMGTRPIRFFAVSRENVRKMADFKLESDGHKRCMVPNDETAS